MGLFYWMEDVAAAPVLPGPSQPTFSRPPGSERRNRKSGTANIFQGALVGLRVRARNRSGLRVESHKDGTGTRWVRAFGHLRINEGSLAQTSEVITGDESNADNEDDDASALGACGGQSSFAAASCDQDDFLPPEEETQGPSGGPRWSWNAVQEKDPERYLHRIRH
ncbi:arginine vasopressin-induced 1 [Labeo rohita]|uniref:Arginine vasopressin-induced 1 n=1 Tax=Labeo rohita TaxID=84645 RepID=A0A498LLD1_LABRO|nr:arginine vasopressin-induced 1 [Labeo rohita]